ncbi:MAG: DNA alkylation repair protein [Myxococcales bacterium]|nr:DNA alkylation repair protein [Myxococcales bacterium]
MAASLKRFFDRKVVSAIAKEIRAAHPAFPGADFERQALAGLDRLELMDRGRHIAEALRAHLPEDPEHAIRILTRSLGPDIPADGSPGMAPFRYLPHTVFVAEHGLDCFETSMRAQRELTRRFTAEFSIRAFIERHPERTLAQLRRWARDEDPHVRRLVSEGTRPRLPWAPRLRAYQRDPSPVLALLELLKDDVSLYVRRSVANNLNDIGKDHPELLVEVCQRWVRGASAERRWVVERALRSLVKQGHPGALGVLGFGGPTRVRVVSSRVAPSRVRIGQSVRIEVEVENAGKGPARAVVDLAVGFVKQRGQTSDKVFKLRALELAPLERASLGKNISLKQHTTRVHHPGEHRVTLLINGKRHPAGKFLLSR